MKAAAAERPAGTEELAVAEHLFETPWGWMAVAASSRGVSAVVLPQPARAEAQQRLQASIGRQKLVAPDRRRRELLAAAAQQLRRFLLGRAVSLQLPVDLSHATPFQRQVWRAAAQIPYGELRSYKWLASRVGRAEAARAVGNALGANRMPIVVPCHRIVAHDGKLGGFTGGLPIKRRLLELEGSLARVPAHGGDGARAKRRLSPRRATVSSSSQCAR